MKLNKYVIRLNEKGYYGKLPFTPVPYDKAIVFDKKKDARRVLSKLNDRLMKSSVAEIEKIMSNKTVILLVGAPGSGKSTWGKHFAETLYSLVSR